MTDHEELLRRVLEDLQQDEDERRPDRPDPTHDVDGFAAKTFKH